MTDREEVPEYILSATSLGPIKVWRRKTHFYRSGTESTTRAGFTERRGIFYNVDKFGILSINKQLK
jgi:hypothetical protein